MSCVTDIFWSRSRKKKVFDNVDSHELFFQSRKTNYIQWVSEKFLYCLITPSLWSVFGISMAGSISLARWNRHDHKRSCTPPPFLVVLPVPVLRSFHIWRNTVVYREKNDCIPSLYRELACGVRFRSYFSVYDRFSPYTVTKIYNRNTGISNTAEYASIRLSKNRRRPFTTLHVNRNPRSGLFSFLPFSIREKLHYVINNCHWNACRAHDHIHGYFKAFTITITRKRNF